MTQEPKPEPGDLDVFLSMAIVIQGKFRDLLMIRDLVRDKISAAGPPSRVIHYTIASVPLQIVKKKFGELEPNGGAKTDG